MGRSASVDDLCQLNSYFVAADELLEEYKTQHEIDQDKLDRQACSAGVERHGINIAEVVVFYNRLVTVRFIMTLILAAKSSCLCESARLLDIATAMYCARTSLMRQMYAGRYETVLQKLDRLSVSALFGRAACRDKVACGRYAGSISKAGGGALQTYRQSLQSWPEKSRGVAEGAEAIIEQVSKHVKGMVVEAATIQAVVVTDRKPYQAQLWQFTKTWPSIDQQLMKRQLELTCEF